MKSRAVHILILVAAVLLTWWVAALSPNRKSIEPVGNGAKRNTPSAVVSTGSTADDRNRAVVKVSSDLSISVAVRDELTGLKLNPTIFECLVDEDRTFDEASWAPLDSLTFSEESKSVQTVRFSMLETTDIDNGPWVVVTDAVLRIQNTDEGESQTLVVPYFTRIRGRVMTPYAEGIPDANTICSVVPSELVDEAMQLEPMEGPAGASDGFMFMKYKGAWSRASWNTQSEPGGVFEFLIPGGGTAFIRGNHADHGSATRKIELAPGDDVYVAIELRGVVTIYGEVVDENGAPLPSVHLRAVAAITEKGLEFSSPDLDAFAVAQITNEGEAVAMIAARELVTDAVGQFVLQAPSANQYCVYSLENPYSKHSLADFGQWTSPYATGGHESDLIASVPVSGLPGARSVTVVDDIGQPVVGALCRMTVRDDRPWYRRLENARTDKDGQLTVPGAEAFGDFTIRVTSPDGSFRRRWRANELTPELVLTELE